MRVIIDGEEETISVSTEETIQSLKRQIFRDAGIPVNQLDVGLGGIEFFCF